MASYLLDLSRLVNADNIRAEGIAVLEEIKDHKYEERDSPRRVDPKKASRVAALGPIYWPERQENLVFRSKSDGGTPVLVAYIGLLALDATNRSLHEGETAYIALPKKVQKEDHEQLGYRLDKTKEHIIVDFLSEKDRQATGHLATIDDTSKTGDTLVNVKKTFPQAQITPYLMYGHNQ